MYKTQQVIQVIKKMTRRWGDITVTWATIIGVIFAVLSYFYGSVTVTDIQGANGCEGFLTNDPSAYVLNNSFSKKKEKEYLKNKINCYRDQIQKHPNNAVAYTNIGEAERRLGNLDSAYQAHQKALQLKPDLPEAKRGLMLVNQDMESKVAAHPAFHGAILYAQQELKNAQTAWQKAKQLAPKLPVISS